MKNPFVTFDDAVNRAADALVLWLWNEFEIKRWPFVRAAYLYAIAFHAVGMGGGDDGNIIVAGLYAVFMLGLLAVIEKRESYPPEFKNAVNLSFRTSIFGRCTRLLQASFVVMVWSDWWLVWSCLQILAVLILSDTLTPTDPPRRKERKLVMAMARGGA